MIDRFAQQEREAEAWAYGHSDKPPEHFSYHIARGTVEDYLRQRTIYYGNEAQDFFLAAYPCPVGVRAISDYAQRKGISMAQYAPQPMASDEYAYLGLVIQMQEEFLPARVAAVRMLQRVSHAWAENEQMLGYATESAQADIDAKSVEALRNRAFLLGICVHIRDDTDYLYRFVEPQIILEYHTYPDKGLDTKIRCVQKWYRRHILGTSLNIGGRPPEKHYDEAHEAFKRKKWKTYKDGFTMWLNSSGQREYLNSNPDDQEGLLQNFKRAMKARRRKDRDEGGT